MFGNKHRIYTVHIDPKGPKPYENPIFVLEGFNIFAFIFTGAWALYNRMWWVAFTIIMCNLMILEMFETGTLDLIGRTILETALMMVVGFEGNEWRRKSLAKRGYVIADIVSGDSLIRAEQRFFDRYFAGNPAAAA